MLIERPWFIKNAFENIRWPSLVEPDTEPDSDWFLDFGGIQAVLLSKSSAIVSARSEAGKGSKMTLRRNGHRIRRRVVDCRRISIPQAALRKLHWNEMDSLENSILVVRFDRAFPAPDYGFPTIPKRIPDGEWAMRFEKHKWRARRLRSSGVVLRVKPVDPYSDAAMAPLFVQRGRKVLPVGLTALPGRGMAVSLAALRPAIVDVLREFGAASRRGKTAAG